MCLCAIYSINAQSQLAERFYGTGEYEKSALAYELEFMRTGADTFLLRKSYAYKAAGEYEKAIRNLERVRSIDIRYEKALLHYLNRDFEASYNQLLRIQLDGEVYQNETFHLLYVMTLIEKHEYQLARNYLLDTYAFGMERDMVDDLISPKMTPKSKDRAYNISLVLPGIGQTYAGYPGRGFVSGLMQVGSAGFTYYSLINSYYFSGVLTGAALFYTFYLGGARYAGQLAERKNEQVKAQLLQSLREEIKKANR